MMREVIEAAITLAAIAVIWLGCWLLRKWQAEETDDEWWDRAHGI